MNLVIILIFILLLIAVVYLVRIERHLVEIAQLQRATTSTDVIKRMENERLESVLLKRFIQEDFSRAEMSQERQQEEFQKWKITNG